MFLEQMQLILTFKTTFRLNEMAFFSNPIEMCFLKHRILSTLFTQSPCRLCLYFSISLSLVIFELIFLCMLPINSNIRVIFYEQNYERSLHISIG